ncbi:hypothetical protein [Listeria costaricensis]|uniref:hypothetical protein n=1 Tax=Listeria costaricensis TaxID=2026604 RepID=UPI000EB602A5|nr:hypothetical protein [Listeria costaricensis]
MTKIKKMLETKTDGTVEQFYPEVHAEGVVGLGSYVSGQIPVGVTSVNHKTGAVELEASDVGAAAATHSHSAATTKVAGFMTAADKAKLDGLGSTTGITEERAEELIHTALSANAQIKLETVKEV